MQSNEDNLLDIYLESQFSLQIRDRKRNCELVEYPNKKQFNPKFTSENDISVTYNNIGVFV
jgi:hypothetical protein